jgi:hypothetical protein
MLTMFSNRTEEEDRTMQDVTEAGEALWTAGLAVVTAILLFALFAATSWAATMLGAWTGSL